ncbi:hypothetical protein BDB00DRAFT_741702, partial [Zychaea mexicana]|uniref:uncharacterized protein n=1 Tax=Zychaea mexicana TaxID=64656 RepID=UPI0022FF33E6
INDGVTYLDHPQPYRATKAVSVDAELVKVNFKHLPFISPEALSAGLQNTMENYGKVCQIRLYRESGTGIFEGEATVIIDITPPDNAMRDDGNPYYMPLRRFIEFDNWGQKFPASWKNCPPICRYCSKEGHRGRDCPKLDPVECYYCRQTGHIQRNC